MEKLRAKHGRQAGEGFLQGLATGPDADTFAFCVRPVISNRDLNEWTRDRAWFEASVEGNPLHIGMIEARARDMMRAVPAPNTNSSVAIGSALANITTVMTSTARGIWYLSRSRYEQLLMDMWSLIYNPQQANNIDHDNNDNTNNNDDIEENNETLANVLALGHEKFMRPLLGEDIMGVCPRQDLNLADFDSTIDAALWSGLDEKFQSLTVSKALYFATPRSAMIYALFLALKEGGLRERQGTNTCGQKGHLLEPNYNQANVCALVKQILDRGGQPGRLWIFSPAENSGLSAQNAQYEARLLERNDENNDECEIFAACVYGTGLIYAAFDKVLKATWTGLT